jgi:hypothetical protein
MTVDASLARELRAIVGDDAIVSRASELKVYECDGWTVEKSAPDLLVMPHSTEEVRAARRGHRALGRRITAGPGDDLHLEDESHTDYRSG